MQWPGSSWRTSEPRRPRAKEANDDELNFPPNFEGLVLGCIDADFFKQILVGISYLFEKKIEKRDMGRD